MIVAAVLAPDETPIIPGSARGFCITACNKAPAAAKHIPMIIASITLGNLRSIIIVCTELLASNKPLKISAVE